MIDWILNNLNTLANIASIFSLVVACLALFCAWKIYKNQTWVSLMAEYRSHQFGSAVKRISDFFIDDCQSDILKIEKNYERIFEKERKKKLKDSETLHFQRRLLSQFYWQLNLCENEKLIKANFNKNELNLMAIVYKMNSVAANNKSMFRPLIKDKILDISDESEGQINKNIKEVYSKFKNIFGQKE